MFEETFVQESKAGAASESATARRKTAVKAKQVAKPVQQPDAEGLQALPSWLAIPLSQSQQRACARYTAPACIRVGSDFSGYGSDALGLRLAMPDLEFAVKFIAENCRAKRHMLRALHKHAGLGKPAVVYKDVTTRNADNAPVVDLLISGAPCPPWSSAGKKRGLLDCRGALIFESLRYVKLKLPRIFVLENVKGLCFKRNLHVLKGIVAGLKASSYRVWYKVLNTRDHGVPQSRPRLYLVAILRAAQALPFHFPKPIGRSPLSRFLRTPAEQGATPWKALKKAKLAKRRWEKAAKGPAVCLVTDVGASPRFASTMSDCCPCLTKSRGRTGHFLIDEGRFTSVVEMGALQGLPEDAVNCMIEAADKVANSGSAAVGQALGDSMSLNVLMRLLPRVLLSAGLVTQLPVDAWARFTSTTGKLPEAVLALPK